MNREFIITGIILAILVIAGCSSQGNSTSGKELKAGEVSQTVYLGLDREGYLPREITVEANKPVTLKNDGTLGGCGMYIIQPELGLSANFAQSNEYTFTPTKKGKFTFTCSMGMFKGVMNVV